MLRAQELPIIRQVDLSQDIDVGPNVDVQRLDQIAGTQTQTLGNVIGGILFQPNNKCKENHNKTNYSRRVHVTNCCKFAK